MRVWTALIIGSLLALAGCATPRADRAWVPYLAQTARVAEADQRFTIQPVSDWSYGPDGATARDYIEATYDMADLKGVWFVLEPQPGSKIAAHTLLLFEFEGDRLLGLTVEARREEGERYSAIRGAFNTFELSYVWATARDLLTGRAVSLKHEVLVYPVAITPEQNRSLLERTLARTKRLETRPRFYNTLFSNCTNELGKAAGLSWRPAFVLTGLSDEHLFERGIIPGASFAEAHAKADMTARIVALNTLPRADFDRELLAELRARLASPPPLSQPQSP